MRDGPKATDVWPRVIAIVGLMLASCGCRRALPGQTSPGDGALLTPTSGNGSWDASAGLRGPWACEQDLAAPWKLGDTGSAEADAKVAFWNDALRDATWK